MPAAFVSVLVVVHLTTTTTIIFSYLLYYFLFPSNKSTWSAVAEKESNLSVQNVGNATGVAVNNFLNGIRASFRSATQSTELRSSNDKN